MKTSCGRILIGLDDRPNSVAKTVDCIDWQLLPGPFTWKDYRPKGITVLCKARNVPSTPPSTIFWIRTHSHDHILKMDTSGTRPPQKFHSPITASLTPCWSAPASISHTHLTIFNFIQVPVCSPLLVCALYQAPANFTCFPSQSGPQGSSCLVWLWVYIGSWGTHRWHRPAWGQAMAIPIDPWDWDLNSHKLLPCPGSDDTQLTCPQPLCIVPDQEVIKRPQAELLGQSLSSPLRKIRRCQWMLPQF